MPVIAAGPVTEPDWQRLQAEDAAYRELNGGAWRERLGLAGLALLLTIALSAYVVVYQPRVLVNHGRAVAIVGLLLGMLALAQLAAVTGGRIYTFAVLPTVLVAMILSIAYDQRSAIGIATIHGLFVTIALGEGFGFFLTLQVGILTACFLLDEVRTRGKLIEVGGVTAVAMMAASVAVGLMTPDPFMTVVQAALYTGAAALGAGFLVLGILPEIEKRSRITTAMSLLELADVSHPLLRKLAMDAPGTYKPLAAGGDARRGGRRGDWGGCPSLPGRGLLPRRGQAQQGRLFRGKPGGRREPPLKPLAVGLAAHHHRARQGRHRTGPRVEPADQTLPLHPEPPRHHAGGIFLPPGPRRARPSGCSTATAPSRR